MISTVIVKIKTNSKTLNEIILI